MPFAVIETGGKQYKVSAGQKLRIATHKGETGDAISFDKVLLTSNGADVQVGTPYVSGAKAEAKITRQAKEKTKIVFRYHSKNRYRKKKGHRQRFTEVEIISL